MSDLFRPFTVGCTTRATLPARLVILNEDCGVIIIVILLRTSLPIEQPNDTAATARKGTIHASKISKKKRLRPND